jgi:CheY-like chemotaxis protein
MKVGAIQEEFSSLSSGKSIQSRRLRRGERMNDLQRYRILLVDDEPTLRDAWTMVLSELGYDVATAADGFDALAQLRCTLPDLVISDLNMPRMSGFEFLKIMCVRFPGIPLIAMSGAYDSKDHFPDRLMVDAVYPKGRCQPEELGRIVADLLRAAPARESPPVRQPASAQVPVFRNGPGRRVPCIELTCTECLRPFSVEFELEVRPETQEIAHCSCCAATVPYAIRFSLAAMLQKVFNAKESVREAVPLFARMGSARSNRVETATRSLLRSLPLSVHIGKPSSTTTSNNDSSKGGRSGLNSSQSVRL